MRTNVVCTMAILLEAASWAAAKDFPPVPRSGFIGFLASEKARGLLKASTHPLLRALAARLGIQSDPQPPGAEPRAAALAEPEAVVGSCGSAAGTRFNFDPRVPPGAAPQNGTTVDFLPGAGLNGGDLVVASANDTRGIFGGIGNSSTGYYVHRNGAASNPCAPDFDGGLPSIADRITGEVLFGGGDSALEADPARGAVFVADTRFGLTVSTIGLFRTTAANLINASACPAGTHDENAARACWPVQTEVNPRADGALNVQPHIAVDPRSSGTGAGDVYIVNTLSTIGATFIVITACTNSLSACSPTFSISANDARPQTPQVRVRPDAQGGITVTYVNIVEGPPPDFLQSFDIQYVTCTPQGAPQPPLCSLPKLIVRESQPIPQRGGGLGDGSLAAVNFQISTFPKHDHRQDANGVETYVVWDRCKVANIAGGGICPDADIRMAASNNNGASWSFGNVDTAPNDQYFPAIRTDDSNTLNIAYMSAQADGMNHRPRVLLRQIAPGASTPDPAGAPQMITSTPMEPSGDFFFGDTFIGTYIGVAARSTASGRHVYVHHTHTIVNGQYNGVPAPEQNNHLSRFDY